MSVFKEFAESAVSGDSRGAIQIWRNSSEAILSEYRKARDDEEGDEWFSGDYGLFDKLIFNGVKNGNPQSLQVVEALISARVMLNEPDNSGYTPVGLLAMIGQKKLLAAAILNGGDVNAGQTNALSMLFGARQLLPNWREVADYLLETGANVNGRSDQAAALFGAVRRNHIEVIDYLVQHGADTKRVYESRHKSQCGTAMHYSLISARSHGTDIETAKLLVHLGGDPTIKNRDGFGAIDAYFAADLEPTGDVQLIVDLYSSSDEWHRSSWHLNTPPPSNYNPVRKQRARNPNDERVWKELPGIVVAFRIGDRVEVIRRAGLYRNRVSLTLLEPSGEREFGGDLTAMPGTTGTIVSWGNEYPAGNHWKAVIKFDPGSWEEVDNYGSILSIGRCRGSLFAECLKIIQTAEESSGASMKVSAVSGSSSSDAAPNILEQFKNWRLWATICAIVLLFVVLR